MDSDAQTKAALEDTGGHRNARTSKPSTPSSARTRSWTIPNQVNDSGAAQ